MTSHPAGALLASAPPPALAFLAPVIQSQSQAVLGILLAVGASAFLSAVRAALQHSLPSRLLARVSGERARERMGVLLEREEPLASSAGVLKVTCDVVFVTLLLARLQGEEPVGWTHVGLALAIAAPTLALVTEMLPLSIARAHGDRLLIAVLPTFAALQLPVALVARLLDALRRSALRVLRIRDHSPEARKLVEGLREMIEDSARSGDLEDTERKLIENVMEFGDVDAAEVMTPRTEIHAADVEGGLDAAVRVIVDAGHSRIPVFEGSIDTIIGTVNALEATKAAAEDRLASTHLRDVLRPPFLVPETKHISEILSEFRAQKQKMAIVVDEYGGTAGIVTLADVVSEIVGDIHDEYAEDEEPLRDLGGGKVEVQAAMHVSEVNEALGLDIPEEEDFETLGGYVLAELGHFPKEGESFTNGEVSFSVVEASDRRVMKVMVNRSA